MLTQHPASLDHPECVKQALAAYHAATDHPDADRAWQAIMAIAELRVRLNEIAAACTDARMREALLTQPYGAQSCLEDALSDVKSALTDWDDDRPGREHGNRLDYTRMLREEY